MRAAHEASATGPYVQPSLDRLLNVAVEISTDEARCVADFLLSWYDAATCGGFNLTAAWQCSPSVKHDMVVVFAWVISGGLAPEALGCADRFEMIAKIWRPNRNVQPIRCEGLEFKI